MIEAEQMRDERLDELAAQAQECVRQRKDRALTMAAHRGLPAPTGIP
jgi:hypothetical protein